MADLHTGDVGKTIKCLCVEDLSNVNTALIKYYNPKGIQGSFPGTVEVPATDGFITYKTVNATDLDMPGLWRFWVHVTLNDGSEISSDAAAVMVYDQGIVS